MPKASYVHVFTGEGEEFQQLVDATLAYQYRHDRPLFGANCTLPEGTFAISR